MTHYLLFSAQQTPKMAQQGQEAMKKLLQNSKGAGFALGLVGAAGGLAYAVSQAMFTGYFTVFILIEIYY